jgi:hypothetical protein
MVSEGVSEMSERIIVSEFARRDGCDEKLVRRAIERGVLVRGPDNKLDAALVGTPWRRSRIDGKKPRRPGEAPAAAAPAPRAAAAPPPDSSAPPAPAPPPAAGPEESEEQRIARLANPGVPSFALSSQREKAAMAQMRELELAQRQGKLVDVEAARTLFFSAFRAIRDHWLAFPSGQSAIIAAKLDVDPDLVSEVLIEFTRKHAAKLVDPNFALQ